MSNISARSWREHITFHWDYDDICLEQDQHGWVELYSTNSLKQYPGCSRVTPLRHIILLPIQHVFNSYSIMLRA